MHDCSSRTSSPANSFIASLEGFVAFLGFESAHRGFQIVRILRGIRRCKLQLSAPQPGANRASAGFSGNAEAIGGQPFASHKRPAPLTLLLRYASQS
jgi:hypothetical protein